jgi:uncharacterized protein YuzE
MKLHYDDKVGALYVALADGEVAESREIRPGVVLDLDAQGRIVGIEVLGLKQT